MKKVLTLFIAALLAIGNTFAGNLYTYTGPTGANWAFVDNAADWNALFTAGASQPVDQYVIPSSATVVVGKFDAGPTINVLLNSAQVTINVDGRLGFRSAGQKRLWLNSSSSVIIGPGGKVGFYETKAASLGFYDGGINWYGNTSEFLVFGAGAPPIVAPTPIVKGPFLVSGPSVLDITDAAAYPTGKTAPKTRVWNGSANDGNWLNAANWDVPVGVFPVPGAPDAADNILLPTGLSSYPELQSQNITAHDILVEIGASLNIDFSSSLDLTGDLYNYGTTTVYFGGALRQAVGSDLYTSLSSTFSVERAMPGQSPWFVGSPVTGLDQSGYSSCGDGQFNPGSACVSPDLGSTDPCVIALNQDYNTTGINCSHSLWNYESSGVFTDGKGYGIYSTPGYLYFNGQTINNGPVSYGPLTISGKGDVNVPGGGTITRGWHMLSNPYPSPITLTAAERLAMGFDAQIFFWDPIIGNWASSIGTVDIAVGQGFQARVTNDGSPTATFSVNNSHRTTLTGVPFYKTGQNSDYVTVKMTQGTDNSTAKIGFASDANEGFDPAYDISRLFGVANLPYVFTTEVNGELLEQNTLPTLAIGTTKTVPLSFRVGAAGNSTLTFENIGAANASSVYLEDLSTGIMYPVTEGYEHSFTANAVGVNNRFSIHFNASEVSSVNNVAAASVKLFPNPTNGFATLMLETNHGFNEIEVLDITGKSIFALSIGENEINKSLDLNGIASGVYSVKLKGYVSVTQKLVKQ